MAEPLPQPGATYSVHEMQVLLRSIEQRFERLEQAINTGYTVTNPTASRTLDVTGATLGDLSAVVGTLIDDMKAAGKLG